MNSVIVRVMEPLTSVAMWPAWVQLVLIRIFEEICCNEFSSISETEGLSPDTLSFPPHENKHLYIPICPG